MAAKSVISLLQKQLQQESENNWEFSCIPKLVQNVAPAPDGEDGPKKHTFPTITIPETVNPGPRALFPEIYFSSYADQELEVRYFSPLSPSTPNSISRPSLQLPTSRQHLSAIPVSIPSTYLTSTVSLSPNAWVISTAIGLKEPL